MVEVKRKGLETTTGIQRTWCQHLLKNTEIVEICSLLKKEIMKGRNVGASISLT